MNKHPGLWGRVFVSVGLIMAMYAGSVTTGKEFVLYTLASLLFTSYALELVRRDSERHLMQRLKDEKDLDKKDLV